MARAKTAKQIAVKIRSTKRELTRLERDRKKAMERERKSKTTRGRSSGRRTARRSTRRRR